MNRARPMATRLKTRSSTGGNLLNGIEPCSIFVQQRSTAFNMLNGIFQHSTSHGTLFNICWTEAATFVAQQMLNRISFALALQWERSAHSNAVFFFGKRNVLNMFHRAVICKILWRSRVGVRLVCQRSWVRILVGDEIFFFSLSFFLLTNGYKEKAHRNLAFAFLVNGYKEKAHRNSPRLPFPRVKIV